MIDLDEIERLAKAAQGPDWDAELALYELRAYMKPNVALEWVQETRRLQAGWDDTEKALFAWMEKEKSRSIENGALKAELQRTRELLEKAMGLAYTALYRIERLTDGFVVDRAERDSAMEAYNEVKDGLAKLRSVSPQGGEK